MERRIAFLSKSFSSKGTGKVTGTDKGAGAVVVAGTDKGDLNIRSLPSLMFYINKYKNECVLKTSNCESQVDNFVDIEDDEINIMWSCTACTLLNDENQIKCLVCEALKPINDTLEAKNSHVTKNTNEYKQRKDDTSFNYDNENNNNIDLTTPIEFSYIHSSENRENGILSILKIPTKDSKIKIKPLTLSINARRLATSRLGKSRFIGNAKKFSTTKYDFILLNTIILYIM